MAENQDFEKKIKRLEEIVSSLEKEEKPLNETVILFKEGIKLAEECRTTLENIEQKISEASVGEEGLKLKKVQSDE